jgi:hypothetical protein
MGAGSALACTMSSAPCLAWITRRLSWAWLLLASGIFSQSLWGAPLDWAGALPVPPVVPGVRMGEPRHHFEDAGAMAGRLRPQDQAWVISTRHLGSPACEIDPPALKFWRYDLAHGRFRPKSAEDFFAADSPDAVTFIYFHGNRIDSWQAIDLGWYTYDSVIAPSHNPQPVRYVIWTWPSTQIPAELHDLRTKAARTDADGYYLAWVLSQMRDDVPVSLMGFSFGARIITGGLHLTAGGDLCGLQLPHESLRPRRPARSALLAAALHNHWLSPGGYHERAIDATAEMLILANSSDRVLRRYHWVFPCEGAVALGRTGLAYWDESGRIQELDCAPCVGRIHDSLAYLNSPEIVGRLQAALLDGVAAAP